MSVGWHCHCRGMGACSDVISGYWRWVSLGRACSCGGFGQWGCGGGACGGGYYTIKLRGEVEKDGFLKAIFCHLTTKFNSVCEKSNRKRNLYNVRKTGEISRILEILGEGSCICLKPCGIAVSLTPCFMYLSIAFVKQMLVLLLL